MKMRMFSSGCDIYYDENFCKGTSLWFLSL
jgi:hypothetical protein